jgi:hypothetical protein
LATRGAASATGFGYGATLISYPVTGFVALVSTQLTSTASTISFSDIPTDKYNHLQIRASTKLTNDAAEGLGLYMRFNNDSGAGKYMYSGQVDTNGAWTPGGFGSNSDSLFYAGNVKGDNDEPLNYSAHIVDIYSAFNTATFKSIKFYNGHTGSTTASGRLKVLWGGGTYESTSPVSTITFTLDGGNFASGTTFSLYGYL